MLADLTDLWSGFVFCLYETVWNNLRGHNPPQYVSYQNFRGNKAEMIAGLDVTDSLGILTETHYLDRKKLKRLLILLE